MILFLVCHYLLETFFPFSYPFPSPSHFPVALTSCVQGAGNPDHPCSTGPCTQGWSSPFITVSSPMWEPPHTSLSCTGVCGMEITFQAVGRLLAGQPCQIICNLQINKLLRKVTFVWIRAWGTALLPGRGLPMEERVIGSVGWSMMLITPRSLFDPHTGHSL